jgi:hypothetical protein
MYRIVLAAQLADVISEAVFNIARPLEAALQQNLDPVLAGRALIVQRVKVSTSQACSANSNYQRF